ncbi:MAG: cation diffusion facilitator family transporter [Bacilli bacterium]|nr:cation diffusion facilitator family transporter [Bacilli bacterium]
MKLELKVLIYSMINNLFIAIIKIIGGIFYGLGSLFADGMHTFSDFITDIVCLLGANLSKKKPTKYHPFGFGKVEYLTNLFVGVILFLLGSYIVISSFFKKATVPPISLLWLLLIVFSLKVIAILIMHKVGEKIHSQLLITSVKESKADLYSTIGVAIITIILQFSNKYPILDKVDIIGSILIGLIVFKTSLEIIIDNSLSIIGEVETDSEENNKIKEILDDNKKIKEYKYELIKYGSYYKLQLTIVLDSRLSLRQVTNLENKLKKEIIRHRKLKIKYVTIYVTNNLKKK